MLILGLAQQLAQQSCFIPQVCPHKRALQGGAQLCTICCDRDCCSKVRELSACLQSHKIGTSCSRVNIGKVRNSLRVPEGLRQSPGGARLLCARHGVSDPQATVAAERGGSADLPSIKVCDWAPSARMVRLAVSPMLLSIETP